MYMSRQVYTKYKCVKREIHKTKQLSGNMLSYDQFISMQFSSTSQRIYFMGYPQMK